VVPDIQRRFGSPLNCWAVSEGIAKGHAELDDVGAALRQARGRISACVK